MQKRIVRVAFLAQIGVKAVFGKTLRIIKHTKTDKARIPCVEAVPPLAGRVVDNVFAVLVNRIYGVCHNRGFKDFTALLVFFAVSVE